MLWESQLEDHRTFKVIGADLVVQKKLSTLNQLSQIIVAVFHVNLSIFQARNSYPRQPPSSPRVAAQRTVQVASSCIFTLRSPSTIVLIPRNTTYRQTVVPINRVRTIIHQGDDLTDGYGKELKSLT